MVGRAGERAGVEDVQWETAPQAGQHGEAVAIAGTHKRTKARVGLGVEEERESSVDAWMKGSGLNG